jgi:glycosyltransferase involved in cell wall biosynthesis
VSPGNHGGLAFCTILPKNRLAQARVLAESIRQHHPGAPLFALLLDPPENYFRPQAEPFTPVALEDLALADLPRTRLLCTPYQLTCAAKPYLLAHLLARYDVGKLVYFDPAVMLRRRLDHLSRLLERHGIALPLALTTLYAEERSPLEPPPVHGPGSTLGFLALARGESAAALLSWWGRRVARDCATAVDHLTAANAWVDVVPRLFDGAVTLCEPEYNAVPEGPSPYFSHFGAGGEPRPLLEEYKGRLFTHGHASSRQWPYTWSRFDNGVPITNLIRRCYFRLAGSAAAFGDPFVTAGEDSFFRRLTSFDGNPLPPLLQEIYDSRLDLRIHFQETAGNSTYVFLDWALTQGTKEHQLDPALLGPVRAAFAKPAELRPRIRGHTIAPSREFGLNVLGFLQSEKGVGEACRSTVRSLRAAGVPHALNNWVDQGSANRDRSLAGITADNPYPVNLIHANADATPFLIREMPWYFEGRYNIGYWNWELEWFPEVWHPSFARYDEIWAPSAFTHQAIAAVAPVPVYLVPFSIKVPPPAPRGRDRKRFGLPAGAFVFLFAFDFQSFFARKNPLAAVEAFRRAFPGRRDVVLALKVNHAQAAPLEFAEVVAACRGQPNIRIIREILPREEMLGLLHACDAYVALHRSEGYGLPIAEAMAMGKPVVATNYSANVDFMNAGNSLPVRYRLVPIERTAGPYRRGAIWADPDVGHAAEQMRRVVEDRDLAARLGAAAQADLERTLSPAAVGETLRARLTAIFRRLPAPRARAG